MSKRGYQAGQAIKDVGCERFKKDINKILFLTSLALVAAAKVENVLNLMFQLSRLQAVSIK